VFKILRRRQRVIIVVLLVHGAHLWHPGSAAAPRGASVPRRRATAAATEDLSTNMTSSYHLHHQLHLHHHNHLTVITACCLCLLPATFRLSVLRSTYVISWHSAVLRTTLHLCCRHSALHWLVIIKERLFDCFIPIIPHLSWADTHGTVCMHLLHRFIITVRCC